MTLNLNIAKRISNRQQWGVKRINHRDGSTTYKCLNCGKVLCHDERGTIRLGVLPHVEGDEDDMTAGVCVSRFTKEYRDKHWVQCRHSADPRSCHSAHKKRISDPDYPTCMRDGQVCDARWIERG